MSTTDPGNNIREQAARWVDRMTDPQESLTDSEREAFGAWIVDPMHAQEFHAINNIVAIVPDLPVADRARLSEWAAKHRDTEADPHKQSRRHLAGWMALAASLIAVAVLGGFYMQSKHWFGGETFVTQTGETRTVTFQEGTVAYMNTRTALRWASTDDEDRRVEFTEGEALFDVVHDAQHPFRVLLDNSEIRVLGTRFNVYRKANGSTVVTVLDGRVEVSGRGGNGNPGWARTLRTSEEIEYGANGLIVEPHSTQAQKAEQWRTGMYRFQDQSVEQVLTELARYTDSRIQIRDPRIAQIRIGGGLSTRDIRDSLRRMQSLAPIEVKENNNTFTLDYRAEDAPRKD